MRVTCHLLGCGIDHYFCQRCGADIADEYPGAAHGWIAEGWIGPMRWRWRKVVRMAGVLWRVR